MWAIFYTYGEVRNKEDGGFSVTRNHFRAMFAKTGNKDEIPFQKAMGDARRKNQKNKRAKREKGER